MITFTRRQTVCHLVIQWILPSYLHRAPRGKCTTFIDNVHPSAPGNLKESATGNQNSLCRITQLQVYVISLSGTDISPVVRI